MQRLEAALEKAKRRDGAVQDELPGAEGGSVIS